MRDTTIASTADHIANVDRIAVTVTGLHVDKVLGIVKTQSGTGETQADATFQLLKLWNVVQDPACMWIDTTASNTGACSILQKPLGKNSYLACRHHIHELIAVAVFAELFGPS